MNKKNFLLEIGVEEIPSRFIQNAMEFLQSNFEYNLKTHKLTYEKIRIYSTPRRFSISIVGTQAKQLDETEEKVGPSIEIAYQNEKLTKAGQGFLRGCGCSESDIFIKETDKGKKIACIKQTKGKLASDILMDTTNQILSAFPFPKSMRWSEKNVFFARPVRWILMLLDDETLPFQWNGLNAGNVTYGNRITGLDKTLNINKISDYEPILEKEFVIPNRAKRLQMIQIMLEQFYQNDDFEYIENDALLSTVTDIVEFPSVVEGFFEERFLTLPEKVIVNTLSENQKYFAVKNKSNNQLTNRFLFISNGRKDFVDIIRQGNEKVIHARLSDAEFYYQEDVKYPIELYVPKLKEVLFEASLGNLLEKTDRIQNLVAFILENQLPQNFSNEMKENAIRAAYLSKADLVTNMLGEKEFTKLQGYIGMNYARVSGENEEVCQAIFEHYLPRGKDDSLPESLIGALVAIADKIDTLCGIIGAGRLPTGSNDPFALRRAASGIVQIIHNHHLSIEIDLLVKKSFLLYENKLEITEKAYEFVMDFFKQRIIWYLQQQKIESDVIKSVMHIDFYNVTDAILRATDLQDYKKRNDFQKLVTSFKRVSNIIEQEKELPTCYEEFFTEESEKQLFSQLQILSQKVEQLLKEKKYHDLLIQLVNFSPYIDDFFENVLVNTDEKSLRINRYSLLSQIRNLFLNVADLAQIIIDDK